MVTIMGVVLWVRGVVGVVLWVAVVVAVVVVVVLQIQTMDYTFGLLDPCPPLPSCILCARKTASLASCTSSYVSSCTFSSAQICSTI